MVKTTQELLAITQLVVIGHEKEEVVREDSHADGGQHFSGASILVLVSGNKHKRGQQKDSSEAKK